MNAKTIIITAIVGLIFLALMGVLQYTENSAREFRANNPQTEVIYGTRVDAAGTLQLVKR